MILKHRFQEIIDKNNMIFSKNTSIEIRKRNVNAKKKIDKKIAY